MSFFQIDKQTPVSLPQICAPRNELLQTFDKAAKNQYIFVHAPAGYGKTISTLLWLKKNCSKVIWISLDAYDNALVLFYRLFCMSILSVIPNNAEILQMVKSSSFSADPVGCTIDMITLLTCDDGHYALVLDDFHLITNEEIKKSLPFVMKRLPLAVKVLILSRNSLTHSLATLQEQQKLSSIDSDDLAFKSGEVRKHFAGYGRFITKEEADKIHAYTEGWVIALNTMAMSGNIDVSGKSSSQSFHSYIEGNIWSRLDSTTREFLIKTSLPDKFTLELCHYLTDDIHCEKIINNLVEGGISISMMGTEYRYHNLFLEFFRSKLEQSNLNKRDLNKKMSEYYLQKGDFLTAKNFAMKSGDIAAISQVVRSFYSLKTFSLDEYIEVNRLYGMHAIPEAICEKMPMLYAPRIFYYYAIGDMNSVNYYFDKLYPLMPMIAQVYPEVMEHVNSMVMLDCRVKLSELPARIERLLDAPHKHNNLQSPTFTCQLPFLHRCIRDFYELTDAQLRENIASFSSSIIKQNVQIMFRGAQSGLLMEQNKLQDALDIAVIIKNSINEDMSPEFVYAVYILKAELYFILRQRDKYDAVIKDAKDYITRHTCQHLLKNLSAYEARTFILNGDKAAAEEWLKNYFVNDNSFAEFYKIYRNFTTARAYILLGKTSNAFDALSELKAMSVIYDRPLDTAEADVLLAISEWSSDKKKEARDRLRNTLISMYQYGFIRVIANEGKAVLPILSAVLKMLEKENCTPDGLYRFAKEIYYAAYDQSKHLKGITYNSERIKAIQLSPQQKHVLTLLCKGYKNSEIVRETGLSLNTIRTHTKLAYQKLEVNNSSDAISRMKQLGIIE